MNEKERILQDVLHALANAQPSDGMQSRILACVQAERQAKPVRWWSNLSFTPLVASGSLCAVMLACFLGFLLRRPHDAVRSPKASPVAVASTSGSDVRPPSGPISSLKARQPQEPPLTLSPHLRTVSTPTRRAVSRGVTHDDRSAEEPSFPPPPLPLTEQEKLLLKLKHRGDPLQLAALVEPEREASFEREKRQVRDFFKGPPPLPDLVPQGGTNPVTIPPKDLNVPSPGDSK